MGDKLTILYECGNCPCFDIHLEKCGLGYTVKFKQKDNRWYHVSLDCRLLEIRTRDKVMTPTALDLPCAGDHEFFKCQVPAGDSCVAIYHQVCRKCRWDENKGIFMPPNIWRGWAVPQLEKLEELDN